MSDNPTCPQFPARPPHGGEPFIVPPAPRRKPGLSVLSVNGRTPDGHGDLALTYIDGAEYAAGYGDPPRPALLFRQGGEVVAVVDATPLLKDGMVSSVAVSDGNLVVTFNTDAGREPVSVPLAEIFDPGAYYDKAAADGRFALKGEMSVVAGAGADADKVTVTLRSGVLATVLRAHQPLDAYFNAAEYDSANKKILFKHGSVVKAQVDATAFVKDGMVSTVAISGGNLVVTFNTDAGKAPVSIPLTDIFNPANYYDKAAADERLSGKADKVADAIAGHLAALDANGNLMDSDNTVQSTFSCNELVVGYSTGRRYVDILGQGAVSDHCTIIVYNSDSLGHFHYLVLPNSDGADKESVLALEREIAPAFDYAATYAEEALVYYNDVLYRCTTAVTTAGDWTGSTNWTVASVEDVLAALRTALAGKADKSTTYTKTEVDAVVQALKTGSRQVVGTLPASGQPMVIYMVPKSASQANNAYDEYIWTAAGAWEKIGDTEIDLSGYYTKTAADAAFVAKVEGKGLSTEDYTTAEQTKLSGIETGAEVNIIETVKVNGTALTPSSKAVDITVPTGSAASKDVPTSGDASTTQVVMGSDSRLSDARTPTAHKSSHATGGSDAIAPSDIGAAASSHTHTASDITSGLATVATTGSYNNLIDKPTIPTVPTNVSAFSNDAGYVTAAALRYAFAATIQPTAGTAAPTGTLTDRAGNKVVCTEATGQTGDNAKLTLTLPPAVSGYMRDFLVKIDRTTSGCYTVDFVPYGNESISYETEDGSMPEVPDGKVTWLSFTESESGGVFTVRAIPLVAVTGGS